MKFKKVVFVSKDGTYRAPLAATILRKLAGNELEVSARGFVVLFPEPINPKGIAVAVSKGINVKETISEELKENDFDAETLVLVMTEKIKQQIYDKFKTAVNVYSLKEFGEGQGDIDTPFGKSINEYLENYDLMEEWVNKAYKKLKELK